MKKIESGVTRYYVTSGPNTVAEYNSSGALVMEHLYTNGTRYATVIPGSDTYYTTADQILSSLVLVDETGNTDRTAEFSPFGTTRSQSGALSNYLFSGKSERSGDPDWSGEQGAGGLYYFGARYYDPALGRWLSADPVPGGKPAGSGQFHSPYVYAGNNPLVMVDPDGEWGFLLPILYGALTGGSVSGLTYFAMAGQDATWQGFTRAFATGALTGAVSGGVSMAFTSMGTGMSANIGYTLLGNASTYAATTAVSGGDLTLGGFAGAVSGGIMGGTMFGSYQPTADGAFRNIFGELIYGGVHGSFIGSLSGGIASAIDYGDFAGGFNRGMSVGGVSGFAQSAVNLNIHGYAKIRNANQTVRLMKAQKEIANPGFYYTSTLRTGGISRWFSNRGYSWGKHSVINRSYDLTIPRQLKAYNWVAVGETVHYYQQIRDGWPNFYRNLYFEQKIYNKGQIDPYTTRGYYEYEAHHS